MRILHFTGTVFVQFSQYCCIPTQTTATVSPSYSQIWIYVLRDKTCNINIAECTPNCAKDKCHQSEAIQTKPLSWSETISPLRTCRN